MAINKANSTAYLKRKYPAKVRMLMGDSHGKLLAMIRKSSEGFGESFDVGVQYGRLPSTGADFDTVQALAAATAPANTKFAITEVAHHTHVHIAGNIIRKTKAGNDGIFRSILDNRTNAAFHTEAHCASRAVYDNGYGSIGVVSSEAGSAITLANPEDAINFDVDMTIKISDTTEAGALRTGTLTVAAVDMDTGVITFDEDVGTTISGTAAGDFISRAGDRGAGASPTRVIMSGLGRWNPDTVASSGDSMFGVDRYAHVTRLAGHRIGALNMGVREAFIKATYRVMNDGATNTHIFCHPSRFEALANDVETQKTYTATNFKSALAEISIPGAKIMTPYGEVNVIPDRYCPVNRSRAVNLEGLELRSEGTWPDFMTFDDGNFITLGASDAGEVRVGGDVQFINYTPNQCCNINHDSAT